MPQRTLLAIGVCAVYVFAIVVVFHWHRRLLIATRTVDKPMIPLSKPIVVTALALVTVTIPFLTFVTLIFLDMDNSGTPLVATFMIALAILVLPVGFGRRRTQAKVISAHYLICPSCHYSLQWLRESGRCPECGGEYDPDSLRSRWNTVFKGWRMKEDPGEFSE